MIVRREVRVELPDRAEDQAGRWLRQCPACRHFVQAESAHRAMVLLWNHTGRVHGVWSGPDLPTSAP
jgi:hypothetical protein